MGGCSVAPGGAGRKTEKCNPFMDVDQGGLDTIQALCQRYTEEVVIALELHKRWICTGAAARFRSAIPAPRPGVGGPVVSHRLPDRAVLDRMRGPAPSSRLARYRTKF